MPKLTKAQLRLLSTSPSAYGPAPGWNASVHLIWEDGMECDGPEIQELFDLGLLEAIPHPPPHEEEADDDAGSITRSHTYVPTSAGRAILKDTPDHA